MRPLALLPLCLALGCGVGSSGAGVGAVDEALVAGNGPVYTGVWINATDASDTQNQFAAGLDINAFITLANNNHAKGLALVNLRTYVESGARKWVGVWRAGNDANYFTVGMSESDLYNLANTRHAQGLRLVDLETYVDNNTRYWAGVWRAGNDAEYYTIDLDLASFNSLATTRHGQGLRLVDIQTYVVAGARKWGGVWRSGSDAEYYTVDLDASQLSTLASQRHAQGLTLVSLETYNSNGTRFAGLWRGQYGYVANYYNLGLDTEALTAYTHSRHKSGLTLVALALCTSDCATSCMNQAVMPDNPATAWQDDYNYGITATATHCNGLPGSCPAPAPGDMVYYRWLGEIEGTNRYLRTSATGGSEQFLTLPFSDTNVIRRGTWLYSPGSWHHAIDYSRNDTASFPVEASAPGTVIHIGWDTWSGNTMVVSHDVNGVQDAYRTIYMHLRNGPLTDCDNAWTKTVPTLSGTRKSTYEAFLAATGCPQFGTRNPSATYWGTSADKIDQTLLGKAVARGQAIAHSGETGPGGCNCTSDDASYTWGGGVNTHLHIFYARRDNTDGNWYFFDPYGIYASPACYPTLTTDPVYTDCARYPVKWMGNQPQYP
jgi:murein DD-endopeptidase MepM/ murein hydrolase activator NlpD